MRTSSIENFERVVSSRRLNSYRRYFKTKTMDEAIGLYLWNGEVSSCFASHLAYFEIVLRNSVHRAMSMFCTRGRSTSAHWYDQIWKTLSPTTQRRIQEVRQRRSKVTLDADEMVASLSLGFWPAVLRNIDHAHANLILPAVFPFHPLSAPVPQWRDTKVRRRALAFVFELHAFRNRLAHHEPLWKFGAMRDASGTPDATNRLPSRSPAESIDRLRGLLALIEDAAGFIDRAMRDDLGQPPGANAWTSCSPSVASSGIVAASMCPIRRF